MAADPARVAAALLARCNATGALELVSCRKVQTLWAGYGFICEVKAVRKTPDGREEQVPLILKLISPPPQQTKTESDEGHLRKMLSYEVERYFYSTIAPSLRERDGVAVAECWATTATPMTSPASTTAAEQKDGVQDPALHGVLAILMTDLRIEFPISGEKRSELSERQVHAAIDWLARFHGSTWARSRTEKLGELVLPPLEEAERRRAKSTGTIGSRVWLNGGYTYLATRRKEFSSLLDQLDEDDEDEDEWASALCRPLGNPQKGSPASGGKEPPCVAEMVARVLAPSGERDCETLIHGDVKSENLFTTAGHERVAFFDFQYVGLGLGVCDLAKLFTCSVPLHLLVGGPAEKNRRQASAVIEHEMGMEKGEEVLLRRYHDLLLAVEATPQGTQGTQGKKVYDWDLFVRHWETALVDWHRFQVSWGQWGNVDWLEARVRAVLRDEGWRAWLRDAFDESCSKPAS
ncbi:hypothetical protein Micbo1qcDRAFT_30592 [Microdochium bolleyi]|uniref:Aminoglycoside phosphotransferase domain-containing protein n=1 Tax=Microdochium bolleyi TaxID=196109 RepID=A0A136JFW3_9PEZI|nr:hypothetical protein Micbo1qcDRAFT_30592 [Microdochium bolleyi]